MTRPERGGDNGRHRERACVSSGVVCAEGELCVVRVASRWVRWRRL